MSKLKFPKVKESHYKVKGGIKRLKKKFYEKELKRLQVELVKLQWWIKAMIVIAERCLTRCIIRRERSIEANLLITIAVTKLTSSICVRETNDTKKNESE